VATTPNLNRLALWRDRIRRQEASGLSNPQFCAQERCSLSSFYRWKRQLAFLDSPDQCPAIPTSPAFLPITLRPLDRSPDELLPIEADLPNGVRLRIPTANTHLACRLVRAIAAARTHSGGSK
jgi:hypothetical protein